LFSSKIKNCDIAIFIELKNMKKICMSLLKDINQNKISRDIVSLVTLPIRDARMRTKLPIFMLHIFTSVFCKIEGIAFII
jgi:hypothetical protein